VFLGRQHDYIVRGRKNAAGANETTGTGKVYRHVRRMRAQYRQQQRALTARWPAKAHHVGPSWVPFALFYWPNAGIPTMGQYIITAGRLRGPYIYTPNSMPYWSDDGPMLLVKYLLRNMVGPSLDQYGMLFGYTFL